MHKTATVVAGQAPADNQKNPYGGTRAQSIGILTPDQELEDERKLLAWETVYDRVRAIGASNDIAVTICDMAYGPASLEREQAACLRLLAKGQYCTREVWNE
jgi:hypothetical protein